MLKLRAKDADKVSLLYEVVDGFRPFLADAELQLEPKEKRARIGCVSGWVDGQRERQRRG